MQTMRSEVPFTNKELKGGAAEAINFHSIYRDSLKILQEQHPVMSNHMRSNRSIHANKTQLFPKFKQLLFGAADHKRLEFLIS